MNDTVLLAGLIAAVVLSVVALVEARGRSLVGWAAFVGFGVLALDMLA